jgi:hypothetical protein
MSAHAPAFWPAGITEPLNVLFGGGVTASRHGETAIWHYEGRAAIVEFAADRAIEATFVERPSIDAVSSLKCAAIYRPPSGYALTPAGCAHMVDDMVAFFSGTREPRFRFAAMSPIEAAG